VVFSSAVPVTPYALAIQPPEKPAPRGMHALATGTNSRPASLALNKEGMVVPRSYRKWWLPSHSATGVHSGLASQLTCGGLGGGPGGAGLGLGGGGGLGLGGGGGLGRGGGGGLGLGDGGGLGGGTGGGGEG
jgi:hypothetical protein